MKRMLIHDQIAHNKRQTVVVMGLMFLLIAAMAFVLALVLMFYMGGGGGAPFGTAAVIAMLVAALYIWISSSFSIDAVIKATGARPANPKIREEKLLVYKVEELSIAAGLSTPPKVYVQESKDINAFATGKRPENSIVCVTTGAMAMLTNEEMEGVLAHELSHILNRDVLLGTITVGVVGAIALLAEIIIRVVFYGGLHGRGGGKNSGPLILVLIVVGIVFAILAPLFARLTYLAMSRKREYLADASGAHLTRNPGGLAAALRKIKGDIPDDPKGSKTAASLYIANPWKRSLKGSLTSTHPPLDERIRRLEGM